MNDEEKQAIEKLHNGKKMDLISIIRTFKREGIEKFVVTKKETVETVLNLIEKQQEEIEDCKKCVIRDDLHNYIEELEKKDNYIKELEEKLSERNMEKR